VLDHAPELADDERLVARHLRAVFAPLPSPRVVSQDDILGRACTFRAHARRARSPF
jgi:hypothetical protein